MTNNLKLARVREDFRQLFGSEAEERVKEQIDGEADEEVVREVAEEVEMKKQEIEDDIDMPLEDLIEDGEMQPFESSDVTIGELQRSLKNLESAQEKLAKEATSYENAYQTLIDQADPDSYTEEEILASRLHKNRVFFETMLHLLNDVGEMVNETVKMLEKGISGRLDHVVGVGNVLPEEDRESIAEEINEIEQEESFGISSRDKLNTGVKGGISQDRKALREASGGIDPVETEMGQTAREILGGDDEDEDEDIGLAF